MANRIVDAIEHKKLQIADRIASGQTTQKKVDETCIAFNMDFEEYCKFQELKSGAMGILLTTEEAMTVYGYLGNTQETFNGQPVEVKAVLTQLFAELLRYRIATKI